MPKTLCKNCIFAIRNDKEQIGCELERLELYKDCLKFLKTRVDLDLALFKDDIWSH